MFSENMFDASVIELEQLIAGLDRERIQELWHVSSLDKKSKHFIVLYDEAAHICTCLTLINRGIVCRHFFVTMLSSTIAKFHVGLVSQRWYAEASMANVNSTLKSEPAIAAFSNEELGTFEHAVEVNFTHLDNLRGQHIFTKEVCQEMTRRQQWGKGFGIMKKTLDLAITTGRSDELYKLHLKLAKEMETEIAARNGEAIEQENDIVEFARTISNPVHVKRKGRKSKRAKGFNDEATRKHHKAKKRKTPEFDQHVGTDTYSKPAVTTCSKRVRKPLQNASDGGMYLIFISFILVICLPY